MRTFITQQEYADRLNHYNRYLMDNKRDICAPYPGYPADVKSADKAKREPVVTAPVEKKRSGRSKIDQAREIFNKNSNLSRDKIVELFIKQLEMTKAGATSYYYTCRK